MSRCTTCNWYGTADAHTCACPKMLYGYDSKIIDDDGVRIENDEGWGMIPGPDFGCIHHMERE